MCIRDSIRTMALCSLPFLGHRESLHEINPESGNFLNILSLISRYDSLLSAHLENEKTDQNTSTMTFKMKSLTC